MTQLENATELCLAETTWQSLDGAAPAPPGT